MKRLKDIIIILLLAVVLPASAVSAKEASVLLQEGLYAEQVEGDLDAAIKIYRQVIAGSEDMKQAAAQATYRIAMCYLKKGRKPEAAKEFRNLLSEFPQQESLVRDAQKQLAKLEPPMPGSFGPVMERTVYDDGAGKDFMLDLDTGECFSVSDANSSKSLESFILERGIDVVGETKESVRGLMGIDMVVIPIANERWEISPGDVLEAVSLGKPGRPVVLSGKGTLPATFIFKTIAGNMGVLQILEVQANQAPRYIRIRYKMLQQKAEREVFIPDADTKGVGVVLDLASGELLKAGTGQEQLTIFRKLGKGDLAYDGVLICLRGAKAKLIVSDMRGDHLTDLTIKGQMEDMTAYELELRTIPGRFSVTTAEGDNYDLIIHSADSTGLTLSYEKDSNENQITALITKFFGAVSQNRNDDAIQMLLYEKPRAERVVMGFQNSPNIGKVRADEIYFTKNLALVVTTEISGPDGGKGRFAIRLVRKNNTWLIEEFDTDIDEEIEAFKKEYVTTQTKIQYRKMPVQGDAAKAMELTPDFDSMDFWQGQIHRYMEAVRTLEGRFITDRQSFGEGQTEPSSHERYRINFKWNRDNAWCDYSWQRLDSKFNDPPERMIKGKEFSWWVHSDGRYITKAKAEAKVGHPMGLWGFSPQDEWWPGDALTINPIAELVSSDFLRNVKYQLKSGLKPEQHSVDTEDNHILEIPVTGLGGEKTYVILTVDWDNGFKLLNLKLKSEEYYGENEVLIDEWSNYVLNNDIWIAQKAIKYNYPDSREANGNKPQVEYRNVVIAEKIIANRLIPAEEFDYQPAVGKNVFDKITGDRYIVWPDFEKIKDLGGKERVSIEGYVFLDGRPVENAVVSTSSYYDPNNDYMRAVQAKTAKNGSFSLDDLLPGFTYGVVAGTDSGMVARETVQMQDDGRDYLNLRINLVTGFTVTGQITDPDGEPIPNAVVSFRDHPLVTTNESGIYTINGLTTGRKYEVQAAAKGYAPLDPGGDVIIQSYQIKLNENGEPQPLNIQLDKEHFIYGRVLDKQGKGVEGVRIFVGDWPFFGRGGKYWQWVNTYTDKIGQFRIGNLGNQEYSVVIGSLGSRKIKPSESPVEIVYDIPEQ